MAEFERWLPVVGFEGHYEVSDAGRVRALHPRTRAGGLLKPDYSARYARVTLTVAGVPRKVRVHLLVMHAFVGPKPDGYEANHIDHDKTNNALPNLEYTTPSDNKRQSIQHLINAGAAPAPYGDGHYAARLTAEVVREVRRLHAEGWTCIALGHRYGVAPSTIRFAVRRTTWAHVV